MWHQMTDGWAYLKTKRKDTIEWERSNIQERMTNQSSWESKRRWDPKQKWRNQS